MAEQLTPVSETNTTVGTERIAVRAPEKGGLLAYLVNEGTVIDLSAIDFKSSTLEMDDGNLRITLPNDQGEILLLDVQAAAESSDAPTLLFADGSSITVDSMLSALASAEAQQETIQEIEPAAGPENNAPTQASDGGYMIPGIIGDAFGDDSQVISDVIDPFGITPSFDSIQTREILENRAQSPLFSNNPPSAVDDNVTTAEDTAINIVVMGNDSDPDGDSFAVSHVGTPSHGTATLNGDGTVTYTPDADYNGTDTFTYTITDPFGYTDTATVTVTVTPVNDGVNAVNDNVTTAEDTAVTINVLANDSDPDGDSFSVTNVGTPSHGTATLNPNGTVTYTPDTNYNGSDSFTYTITDSQGATDTATVTINVTPVNDGVNAVNDNVTTAEDTAVTINVLANDSDPDGDSFNVTNVGNPSHGTATLNPNGTVTYTPDADYNGSDSFTYTITDSQGATDTATVTINVTPVNDGLNAVNDRITTAEDTAVTINVLANDSDPDGDSFSVTGTSNPSHGSVQVNPNGTVTYTPNADYNGTDTFTYTITDSQGATDTATVTITVTPANDGVNAVNDRVTTQEDKAVTINVLANDSDPDGDSFNVTGTSNPSHGSVHVNANGTITYTPDADYNGSDSFTYTITDSQGATDTATVTVNVTPVNDGVNAVNDRVTTQEDKAVTINVLANDSDPDGDSFSITGTSNPSHGSVHVNANGTITYTPDANYNGTDTFTYTIKDSRGATDTATVRVNVTPVNDGVNAVNDRVTTQEDTAIRIHVLNNDSDPDGDSFSITGTSNPSHGSVHVNANGTITYTPDSNYHGVDTFTYTIKDSQGATDTATVRVNVTSVNDGVNAVNDNATTTEDTAIRINVLNNDSDPDGDSFSITGTTNPSHGSVHVNANGTITYTPHNNYSGSDSFTYTIKDSQGATDTATVRINVTPAPNTAPIANDDMGSGISGQYVHLNLLGNDSDPDGDTLSVQNIYNISGGNVIQLGGEGSYYVSNMGTGNVVTFDYKISDGKGGTDTAHVTVTFTTPHTPGGGGGSGDGGGGGSDGGDTPLVIDLDGDGVEIQNLDESNATFDIDNDGTAEHTAWVDSDDGFLVLDRNDDGTINDRSEMFGDMRGAEHGFDDLALLDSNDDNVIDSQDDAYNELQVWQDADGDGETDEGELFMLSDLGITSISLDADFVDTTNNGQYVSHSSTVTYEDGTTHAIDDVWFQSEDIAVNNDDAISADDVLAYNSAPEATGMAEEVFQAEAPTDTMATHVDTDLGSSSADALTALGIDVTPQNPDAV